MDRAQMVSVNISWSKDLASIIDRPSPRHFCQRKLPVEASNRVAALRLVLKN